MELRVTNTNTHTHTHTHTRRGNDKRGHLRVACVRRHAASLQGRQDEALLFCVCPVTGLFYFCSRPFLLLVSPLAGRKREGSLPPFLSFARALFPTFCLIFYSLLPSFSFVMSLSFPLPPPPQPSSNLTPPHATHLSKIATVAIMGLEATYKKLIALKSLTVIQDDGSWPAI
jgi:hypothetical protein